jgi:hypothetical protein
MKKLLLGTLLLLSAFTTFSQQIITTTLAKGVEYNWKIQKDVENGVETTYFIFQFKNGKYNYIYDVGTIFIGNKEGLQMLIDKLKVFSKIPPKSNIRDHGDGFNINLYDFSNNIYLEDLDGAYILISKANAIKLSIVLQNNITLLK